MREDSPGAHPSRSSAGVGAGRPVSYIAMEVEDDFELRLRDTGRPQLLLQNTAVNCIKSLAGVNGEGSPSLARGGFVPRGPALLERQTM